DEADARKKRLEATDTHIAEMSKAEKVRAEAKGEIPDLDQWTTAPAVALRSASTEKQASEAKQSLVFQRNARNTEINDLKAAVQATAGDVSTWACWPQIQAHQRTLGNDAFTALLNSWREAILSLEALDSRVSESTGIQAPAAATQGAVANLNNALGARATSAADPPTQLQAAMGMWTPLREGLLAVIYRDYMGAQGGALIGDVTDLIDEVVSRNLIQPVQTSAYQAVSDATGATRQSDMGMSTEYALPGLANITIHVHWVKNQIGKRVAPGRNPTHWKTKGNRRGAGSHNIDSALALKVHRLADKGKFG
ncbi:MAG: hypothetical protein AB7L84_16360, partial [Acidimicrobiia bacterium]